MNIAIVGEHGQMVRAMIGALDKHQPRPKMTGNLKIVDSFWSAGQAPCVHDCVSKADVVIDFSVPQLTSHVLALCDYHSKPAVIGTTGHGGGSCASFCDWNTFAKKVPFVRASNYSVGMNTLFWLARKTAEVLGPEYDLEVMEVHHRRKKDAPSGSAKTLGVALSHARGSGPLEMQARYGRQEGFSEDRSPKEIYFHSVRGGDVVGDHTVFFLGLGDRVELTHRATSRETFALGALRAAEWILGKPAGLYEMADVLGLPK
ncbi:MAG: 4-hydroxy-tetrahydrodipicolinate reductase [bacterium]|nr:4-hydroxy-tetrahydrodipicolinate reductase [bacterium]